jgi:hypothetical protein
MASDLPQVEMFGPRLEYEIKAALVLGEGGNDLL